MLSLPAQKELLSGPCGDHIDSLFNVHNTGSTGHYSVRQFSCARRQLTCRHGQPGGLPQRGERRSTTERLEVKKWPHIGTQQGLFETRVILSNPQAKPSSEDGEKEGRGPGLLRQPMIELNSAQKTDLTNLGFQQAKADQTQRGYDCSWRTPRRYEEMALLWKPHLTFHHLGLFDSPFRTFCRALHRQMRRISCAHFNPKTQHPTRSNPSPFYIHCTADKNRTGTNVKVLLRPIGASPNTTA